MPDENSAATEHAIIQEITAPLATLPDDPVPAVADVEFPVALRGYDRLAVDAYVKRTSQLVAELQATRSPEAAIRRALERVGAEVAGILQRAHEAAAQITAQSRREAEDRLERARQEAAEIVAGAERRLKDLDAETDRIWAERHRIVEDAQDLAGQLLTLAEAAAQRFPAEEPLDDEAPGAVPFGVEAFDGEPPDGDPSGVVPFDAEPPDGEPPDGEPDVELQDRDARTEHRPDEPAPTGEPAEPQSSRDYDADATVIMPPIAPDEHAPGP
jgi:vacuolar-type H+-ATPase subunit H